VRADEIWTGKVIGIVFLACAEPWCLPARGLL